MEKKDTGDGATAEKLIQEALEKRLNGKLVTMDINGHLFYVDIPMGMLRPKDDFMASGIKFDELSNYLNEMRTAYQIPYDPKKHSFQQIDYRTVTEIPKELLIIEFPHQRILDPVGYSRKYGLDLKECLQETGFRSHFTAKKVEGTHRGTSLILAETLKQQAAKTKTKPKRKGRRI